MRSSVANLVLSAMSVTRGRAPTKSIANVAIETIRHPGFHPASPLPVKIDDQSAIINIEEALAHSPRRVRGHTE